MEKVYGVIFKDGGKSANFKSELAIDDGTNVIVNTDKGLQFAKVLNSVEEPIEDEDNEIVRIASEEDYEKYLANLKDADIALKKSADLVKSMGLKMRFASASYNFDRSQLILNFTADERIDFRELAKKLAGIYHTRIELHQIGARDKARVISGIGICGKKLCCSNFLKQIDGISMSMAKNQNLSLNPSKINGCCGRLLCCLAYEDKEYLECSKGMPTVGSQMTTEKGVGIVQSVDILNRKCTVVIDGDKEEILIDDCQE